MRRGKDNEMKRYLSNKVNTKKEENVWKKYKQEKNKLDRSEYKEKNSREGDSGTVGKNSWRFERKTTRKSMRRAI